MIHNSTLSETCRKETLSAIEGGCAATLGFFDGVHRGHRFLLDRLREVAEERKLPSLVLSFWPHPHQVLNNSPLPLLSDCAEKKGLIETSGIGHVVILPFTAELSRLSARDFMQQVLCDTFHVRTLLMGYDHRFGHRGQTVECFDDYRRYGKSMDMEILQAGPASTEGTPVSSSAIREALLSHDILSANRSLGYLYYFSGKVVGGHENGHRLGFPTANILPDSPDKLIPANGVYAVEVTVDGEGPFGGMLNIGCRPTLQNGGERSIEVHIFDFAKDIYHAHVTVYFHRFVREEQNFHTLESLAGQLQKDREEVTAILHECGGQNIEPLLP